MKYVQTPDDIKIMQNDMRNNRTLQHLQNLNLYKFSIGDVLIREDKYGDTWKVKTASCGLPYKYVYAFENELGIGYIRRLSVNGRKFVDSPVCVVYFDPDKTRFAIDPSYADHILLSGEDEAFDAKGQYAEVKKRREQRHRKNRKLAEVVTSVSDAVEVFKKMKVGDPFWLSYSVANIRKEPCYVTHIELRPDPANSEKEPYIEWSYTAPTATAPQTANSFLRWQNPYRVRASDLTRKLIFLTKPTFAEDIVS